MTQAVKMKPLPDMESLTFFSHFVKVVASATHIEKRAGVGWGCRKRSKAMQNYNGFFIDAEHISPFSELISVNVLCNITCID